MSGLKIFEIFVHMMNVEDCEFDCLVELERLFVNYLCYD